MKIFEQAIQQAQQILSSLNTLEPEILQAANTLKQSFMKGNKVLLIGNGGSAADAQHFAAELMVRFKKERLPYPAIALTTDSSILTAHGNDYNFETIFKRQVEALGNQGDCLFALSTSGNSRNILEAIGAAQKKGLLVIGLTGADGGKMGEMCDTLIMVPSSITARIQETHIFIIHILCQLLENSE